jgi:hypothetical protein
MFRLGFIVVVVAVVAGGFAYWARVRVRPGTVGGAGVPREGRRVSPLTEAVAYVGAILLLAGATTAIGQRWEDLGRWGRVGVVAAGAALFLQLGSLVRPVREPAVQRLVGVSWLVSAVGVGWAVELVTADARGEPYDHTALVTGLAVTGYATVLWLLRRRTPQNLAVLAGLIVTVTGLVIALGGADSPLSFGLALWGLGVAWALAGWRRYVEPVWATIPAGVVLALFAPSVAVGAHGWLYAVAIGTAAVVMAASVPLRSPPLLGLGAVAMFGYLTGAVVRYFGDSLGVPAALAVTGLLIIGLAVVTARLARATRPAPATGGPPGEPGEPGERGEPGEPTAPTGRGLSRTG